MKSRRISWDPKKFLGNLRNFLDSEEIPWKSVDAAQDAMPRDRPCSHFIGFTCKTKGIPCLRGRPARPAKRQKCIRRSAFPWNSTGITWKARKFLEMCGDFMELEEIPGNPQELPWDSNKILRF